MRSSSHSHLGIFLVLLLVCAAGLGLYSSSREAAQAADSAMLHQGSSLDTGSGHLLWRHKTAGPVITSPAMANGIVYVGNYAYDFYALKASTGKLAWLYKMDYWVTSRKQPKEVI